MSTAQSLRLQVILGAVDTLTKPLRSMLDSSHGLSRAVKETRDRLRDLETQQKRLDGFRKTADDIQATARALDAAKAKVRDLRGEIIASDKPHKNLTDSYRAAQKEVRQLERQQTALARAHETARVNVERMGVPVGQLAARQRQLAGEIERTNGQLTQHGQRLAQVRERQRDWNRAIEARNQLLNAGASMVAAGAAMGAPIVAAVKNFATFEDAMIGVAKQVEGARDSNGQLTRTYYEMADAIRTLSTDARIGQSATQIAALIEAGARMGIQGKDNLLEYARTAGIAASAFSVAADQIGEDIAKVANLYKIPIANIGELGDTINWLDDNAQSKGGDIINVLTRIAGISQTVRMTFRDAAALGSTFLSLGASAEVAATGANAVIRELAIAANQPAKFQAALKSLGLSPDAVQAGMLKDSTGTILRVLEAIKSLPAENQLATTVGLFGKEYGDDVAKLAENMDEYRRQLALANSEQAKGSMAREADARAMALSARWQVVMNGLFNASSRAGETLKGTLVGILEAVGRAVSAIDGWMQRNPGFTSALMHVAAAVAAIVTGLGALALGVAAVIGPIAVLKFGLAFIAPLLAGISAPALAVVGAVAAVGAAAWALYANWDAVKAKFVTLWEGIKGIFQGGVDWVLKKIESLRNAVSLNFNATVGTPAAAAPLRTAAASGGNVTS
ncbi:MAG: phage tail tape measure protein, partial [Proteobacteria bacterium]|nr:phage tail tape measure protein [Pseudomonadota bacterium]